MTTITRAAAATFVVALMAGGAQAQTVTRGNYEEHSFVITLPEGFTKFAESASVPGAMRFDYSSELRSDGSRGAIQVSIVDLKRTGNQGLSLEEFSKALMAGFSPSIADWKEKEATGDLNGVPAKRIAWSGTMAAPDGSVGRVPVAGVSILGVKDDVGFCVQSVDREANALLRRSEAALLTFTLAVGARVQRPAPPPGASPPPASNTVQSIAALKEACDAGNGPQCAELGDVYYLGKGVPADSVRAAPLYDLACRRGHAGACRVLGQMYRLGTGVPKDALRASASYKQSCDGGVALSCWDLGLMYVEGTGLPKDLPRAVALFRTACNGGAMEGCNDLGLRIDKGEAVSQDPAGAASLYRQSCDGGYALGCSNLGILYLKGTGVPRDAIRAAALYKQACDSALHTACRGLGVLYMQGAGVPRDPALAVAIFKKACDAGDAGSCSNLGLAYVTGQGVAKDARRGGVRHKCG